jgi:hypothetical protein
MEELTEEEREFIAIVMDKERCLLWKDNAQIFDDREHDLEIRAQQIERCSEIIRKMGGSILMGVKE